MVVLIVVRTEIAKFGPGQFKFVLAKTEIPVFGPEQNHPARGGEIAIILTGHVLSFPLRAFGQFREFGYL